MRRLPFLLGGVLATAGVSAQDVRWRLPEGGAITFTVEETAECKEVAEPHRNAAPPDGVLPHAPLLLATELAADARSTTVRLHDVRWLGPRLAFDLRTFGQARDLDFVLDDVVPFTPLRVQGKASDIDANGTQTLALTLAPAVRPVAPNDPNGPARQVHFDASCHGTLTISRTVDAAAGLVRAVATDLSLRIEYSTRYPIRHADYVLHQKWTNGTVLTRRQAGFTAKVADAIRRGAMKVRHELTIPDRGLLEPKDDAPQPEGYLALGLLTLLHAEVAADDAVVRQGFAHLRRRRVRETYSLALAMMALERLHAPLHERDQLLSGALAKPVPRHLVGDDAIAMQRWTTDLLANRDSDVRPEYLTRWRYSGPGFDNSNTQYGGLGLHSADLCEQKIGRTNWFAVAAHWLEVQCPAEGPAVPVSLLPIEPATAANNPGQSGKPGTTTGGGRTTAQRRAAPRGWDYGRGDATPYGGMTTAGISSLTIALSHLQQGKGKVDGDLRKKIDQAILSGFAWLSKWKAPRHVPGADLGHAMNWWYYHLYGLERACELSNVGLIDGHDWYHDHALLLLASQQADGGWGRLEETCWAILFLKKAQLPVFTRPR